MSETDPRTTEASGASRRTFLAGAGLTGLAVAGTGVMSVADAQAAAVVPARYALEFDGAKAGAPPKAVGGDLYANVLTATSGGAIREKHITDSVYSDISIGFGPGMSSAFYAAITRFTAGNAGSHDGRITRRDNANKVFNTVEFFGAYLTSMVMPAVEMGAKGGASIALGLQPGRTRLNGTPGAAQTAPSRPAWTTGGFRLAINAIGDRPKIDTSKVVKISSITFKQTVTPSTAPGGGGTPSLGPLELSDISFAVADNNPASLYAWYRDYIIDGNRTAGFERSGSIVYLDATGRAIFALILNNVGIMRLTPATSLVGSETVVRTNASIYAESATFSVAGGVAL